jgi:outer membrane receptor protein involved in Fe transport
MQLRFRILKYVLTASLAAAGMASAQTPPAPAPDAAQQAPAPAATAEAAAAPAAEAAPKKSATEEIVVTGTRVRRKDLNTPAPVTVLSRDQISASGKVSLGEFLQALPEQGNSGANAQVNNGNDGSIYVSLRSLGVQRTLVLVNGRRMVPGGTGANSAADLGTIPSAAIERIEVLKDGASAIYGSDAIAGVVNVILRKRFNGTEVGGYAGTSGHGDGNTYDVHAVTGTAGDKGSMLFSAAYQEQKPVHSGDRDFSKTTYNFDFGQGCYADPISGNCVDKSLSGSGNSTTWPHGRFSIPGSACTKNTPAFLAAHPALASVCFQSKNKGGRFMQDPSKIASGPNDPNAQNYVPYDPNFLYNTNPTNYLITPSRRVQLFSTGDVNLGSEARAFFEASYVNRTSAQSLAPMPLVNSTIPTQPVTISKDSIYNPFGVNITSWRKRTVEFGERFWKQDLDTFRVVAGLDGSLGEWAGPAAGWAWDVDYNHGRTAGTQFETGQLRMPNVANAVGPSMIDPASGKPICLRVAGDPTSVIKGCVPMDVLHGVGGLSQSAKGYVSYDGTDFGTNQQDIWSVNLSGDLFKIAADRPAGLAIGADYRRESASFINNPINSGESSGNNQLSTNGGYNVKEAYAELVVPVLNGMLGIEDLELQAAARYNDFSTFGTNTTYKLGVRWSPIRDITARATYGTAFRAPNVAELYGGAADDYPGVRDPCRAPTDPTVIARCIANGVPGGASGDASTQMLSRHISAPDLGPETANTFTAGVVLQPQMVKNLSVTVDYYNVNVAQSINTRGAAFILDQCYTAAVSDKALCALIIRDQAGFITQINDPRLNAGNFHTTGIDFAVRYAQPTEDFGRFNLIIDGAYLNSFRITDLAGVITNGVGNYDIGVLPSLKLNAGVFWTMGPIGVGVSGRYIGAYKECGSGSCTTDDTQQRRIDHYTTVDLFASYTLKNWAAGTTALVVGVTNVGDTQPPYIANAFSANSDPSTYDYVGRFVYTRLTHTF